MSQEAKSTVSRFASIPELWRYRELLWQFSRREVELRHKGSHLGLIWSVLNPLLVMGVYVFIFSYIFNGSSGVPHHDTRMDYALSVFLGLTVFQFLAEIISLAPNLIVANPNFVKKVIFPLEVLPASTVCAAVFHLLISLGLVLLGIIFLGAGLNSGVLWLPIIILPLALLALGMAWIISALGVFLRDLTQVTQFVTLVLMYASAVFYPVQKIPETSLLLWQVLRLNPLLLDLELARNAILWERAMNFRHLAYLYVVGVGMCYLGLFFFRRLKPAFADVL